MTTSTTNSGFYGVFCLWSWILIVDLNLAWEFAKRIWFNSIFFYKFDFAWQNSHLLLNFNPLYSFGWRMNGDKKQYNTKSMISLCCCFSHRNKLLTTLICHIATRAQMANLSLSLFIPRYFVLNAQNDIMFAWESEWH